MILGYQKIAFTEPFVTAVGGKIATHDEIMANRTLPMAVSGLTKSVVPNQARLHGLDWYYIDTGYFGNHLAKIWFRVTRNACQNVGPIKSRPHDRLRKLRIDLTPYRRGRNLMLVPPDKKVCAFYGLPEPDIWIAQTKQAIARFSDRALVVRERPASRNARVTTEKFSRALATQDINAVVVYSSNCAVESVMHGIPVVCLGESAAQPLAGSLPQIDSLPDLDRDDIDAWLRHLSYCQFTRTEMANGLAWKLLHE